jgi:hypothetical protein
MAYYPDSYFVAHGCAQLAGPYSSPEQAEQAFKAVSDADFKIVKVPGHQPSKFKYDVLKYGQRTTALGRNRYLYMAGMVVSSSQLASGAPCVDLNPFTTKGHRSDSAKLSVPLSDLPALIALLQSHLPTP